MEKNEKNQTWVQQQNVIDDYIFNRISDVDRHRFETLLEKDEALREQFLNEKRIVAAIRMKGRLQKKEAVRQRIGQSAEVPAQGGRIFSLSAPHILLKIAAAIALFVVVPSVVYMVYEREPEKAAFVDAEIPGSISDSDEGAKKEIATASDPKIEPGTKKLAESSPVAVPGKEVTETAELKDEPETPGEKSIILSVPSRKTENDESGLKESFDKNEEVVTQEEQLSFGAGKKALKKIPKRTTNLEAQPTYTLSVTTEKSGKSAGKCNLTFVAPEQEIYEENKGRLLWFNAFVDQNQADQFEITILLDPKTFADQFESAKVRLDGNHLILDLGYRSFLFDITHGELQRTQ